MRLLRRELSNKSEAVPRQWRWMWPCCSKHCYKLWITDMISSCCLVQPLLKSFRSVMWVKTNEIFMLCLQPVLQNVSAKQCLVSFPNLIMTSESVRKPDTYDIYKWLQLTNKCDSFVCNKTKKRQNPRNMGWSKSQCTNTANNKLTTTT